MGKVIYCLAEMAYQFNMNLDLRGGGERWLEDFVSLLKNNGYIVKLYQFSHKYEVKKFRGHKITGIGNIKTNNYENDSLEGVKYFQEQAKDADGIFLLSMNLSKFKFHKPTLTVSHGLWFDNNTDYTNHGFNLMDMMKNWVRNATKVISVDTNSIHAMQLLYPKFCGNMTYIPNYVDLNIFKSNEIEDDGKFRIIFARRISPERGYKVMLEASKIICQKYNDIEITFCGNGHEHELNYLKNEIKDIPSISHTYYEPNDMYKAYDNQHVSIVSTIRGEGTSLSCLESLASGCVPIVTTIGGLTDIVRHGCDGLIIPPGDVDELVKAIEYLYNNRDKLKEMRDNGLRNINAFSKDRWESQILEIANETYK